MMNGVKYYKLMGVKASSNAESQEDPTFDAILFDENEKCKLYRNGNGEQFEKYRVENVNIPYFENRYEYRVQHFSEYLVRALFAKPLDGNFGCTFGDVYDIVIERIPERLSNIKELNQIQAFLMVGRSLKGFHQIFKSTGLILVKDNMIGVSQYGQIKVWLNADFSLNFPEPQPISYSMLDDNDKEPIMVDNIIELVNSRTKRSSYWRGFIEEKYQSGKLTFSRAFDLLHGFLLKNTIELPNDFNKCKNWVYRNRISTGAFKTNRINEDGVNFHNNRNSNNNLHAPQKNLQQKQKVSISQSNTSFGSLKPSHASAILNSSQPCPHLLRPIIVYNQKSQIPLHTRQIQPNTQIITNLNHTSKNLEAQQNIFLPKSSRSSMLRAQFQVGLQKEEKISEKTNPILCDNEKKQIIRDKQTRIKEKNRSILMEKSKKNFFDRVKQSCVCEDLKEIKQNTKMIEKYKDGNSRLVQVPSSNIIPKISKQAQASQSNSNNHSSMMKKMPKNKKKLKNYTVDSENIRFSAKELTYQKKNMKEKVSKQSYQKQQNYRLSEKQHLKSIMPHLYQEMKSSLDGSFIFAKSSKRREGKNFLTGRRSAQKYFFERRRQRVQSDNYKLNASLATNQNLKNLISYKDLRYLLKSSKKHRNT